nr:MAG TPA: hypothetical protein [Caudoviricetes sp.]DAT51031.1 MAG TPA: hypothetical protein [Caudoviricetes sp.]
MKMPPEVLRLSGDSSFATFKRLWLATIDYRLCSALLAALGLLHSRCREFLKSPPQIDRKRNTERTLDASHPVRYKRRKYAR